MFHIGILQLTQHLDDAVRGFKWGLQSLGVQAEFHYVNADGSAKELPKLAEQLAEQKVDLIFACSTPAAKAANALPRPIPVVFTPVFDPVGAGLVTSMIRPGGKLTGMSGMVAASAKVEFIAELLPGCKKIGVLYHLQDENALLEVEHFLAAADGRFDVISLPFARQEELSLLSGRLTPDLDALFLPIGRVAEENFSSIAYYTDEAGIPIVASHAPNVAMGAVGALVADHAALGEACAAQAKRILVDGVLPGDIPVGIAESPQIVLNASAAENLNIVLPGALRNRAAEIYD